MPTKTPAPLLFAFGALAGLGCAEPAPGPGAAASEQPGGSAVEDTAPGGTEDSGGTGTGTEDPGPEGMARIAAGTAILGCTVGTECEGLGIWTVEITRDYWMDTHEVTREQFALLEERD